jgi:hypothetical protein
MIIERVVDNGEHGLLKHCDAQNISKIMLKRILTPPLM